MNAASSTLTPSQAAKMSQNESGETKKTREEWKKERELEEARKLGQIPALVDEEGKDINPHIPQYVSAAPWYLGFDKPTLKHQRVQEEKVKKYDTINKWYKRGTKEGSVATKYRKGACENCGALGHAKKECPERPRKVGAKFTGEMIAPDDFQQPDLSLDYDGKRDRWSGYDPLNHQAVIEKYAKVEEAKHQLKSQKLQEEIMSGKLSEEAAKKVKDQIDDKQDSDESDSDEDKYAEKIDMPGTNFDTKRRITVRNLRIREDTAKYLRNLDPNSAYYDPKTRAMRENPYSNTGKLPDELDYAGDNFVRADGDTKKMAQAQLFAWEAFDKGTDVHILADPTKSELLNQEYKVRKEDFDQGRREGILERYGGAQHLEAPPRQLLLAQTEDYVEYSRHGQVLKGQEKAAAISKYLEDVHPQNHTSIWGSYWRAGRWGYRCCHSSVRMSYCTGEAGKEGHASDDNLLHSTSDLQDQPKSLVQQHQEKMEEESEKRRKKKKSRKERRKNRKKIKQQLSDSDSDSEAEDEEREKKERIAKAIEAQREREEEVERLLKMDERKRPYNSLAKAMDYKEPTEEEMEAYYLKKRKVDDPMSQFFNK